jgi:hypothetical protein
MSFTICALHEILREVNEDEVSGSWMKQDRRSLLADLNTPTSHLEDPGFDFRYERLLTWRRTSASICSSSEQMMEQYFKTDDNQHNDSSVGIATSYGLEGRGVGVRVPVWSRIFSSPHRPNRLWGPPNLLSNGYRGSFPGGKAAEVWSWPLTYS